MEVFNLHRTKILDWEYSGRDDITEVILDNEVTEVGVGAFHNCANLKRVALGPQVELVKEGAFSSCPKLAELCYSKKTNFENFCFNHSGGLVNIIEDGLCARAFYFPVDDQYAITIKSDDLCTNEYEVYEGRMATPNFFPRGKVDTKQKLLYFVVINKEGTEYSWFNDNLELAIISARYKASGLSYNDFFHTKLTMNSQVSWDELAMLMGVCLTGKILWRIALQDLGLDPEGTAPLSSILPWLQKLDGTLYARASLGVARAHLPRNFLNYSDMISGSWFERHLIEMLRTQGQLIQPNKG